MSVNKLISIKTPVVDAMDKLGIDHDKFIPLFTRWATLAEKEIGSKYQYITKREVLTVNNCAACLPSDAVFIQTAVLGDLGCDCADLMANVCGCINSTMGTLSPTGGSFLIVDVGDGNGSSIRGYINHTVQNNKLVFDQNFDGKAVTIQYLAPSTDCDGFTEIGQNHVLAITWYIIWQYFFRKVGMNSLEYGKMNKAEQEWHRECSHARAVDGQLTDSERQQIVYEILHNPYIGISVSVGMHTTLDNGWTSNF